MFQQTVELLLIPMNEQTELEFDLRGVQGESIELSAVIEDGQINVSRVRYLSGTREIAANNLTLYPNPTTGNLNVKLDHSGYSKVKIQVLDIQGKMIKELNPSLMEIANGQIQLDLHELKSGMYIIHLTGNTERTVELKSASFIKK
jgi:hypothetical protein